jgi:hypothetical protein
MVAILSVVNIAISLGEVDPMLMKLVPKPALVM